MTKKQQAIELWRACFNDTEEFIQFYFASKYQDENTLLYHEGDAAIAVTQMLPYPMTWCGRQIMTSYISGACTLPAARGKGVMKDLLKESFAIMKSRDIALSTLIPAEPWLFGFYQKCGYTTVFDHSIEKYILDPSVINNSGNTYSVKEYNDIAEILYPWFSEKMGARKSCIQHPFDDYMAILQDLYNDGGKLFIAYTAPEIFTGIAFAIPYGDTVYIPEILCDSTAVKESLLQCIANEYSSGKIECHVPPVTGSPVIHKGMARIINAKKMLAMYAQYYPENKFSLKLHDEQLLENNGYYFIEQGNCTHSDTSSATPDFNMDIQTLTQVIMGYHPEQLSPLYPLFKEQQPYMSLMLE